MSSFGKDLVCTNLTCTTINGNSPSGGSSKWTDVGNDNIERTNGNVIVKNELIAETATINDNLTVKDGPSILNGTTELITKLGSQYILLMGGTRSANSTYIDVNTAEVDISNAESIYLVQMQTKPDGSTPKFFRINMSGDIIGARNVALERLTLPFQLSHKGCAVITTLTGGTAGDRTVQIPFSEFICFFDLTFTTADIAAGVKILNITFDTSVLPISASEITSRKYVVDVTRPQTEYNATDTRLDVLNQFTFITKPGCYCTSARFV